LNLDSQQGSNQPEASAAEIRISKSETNPNGYLMNTRLNTPVALIIATITLAPAATSPGQDAKKADNPNAPDAKAKVNPSVVAPEKPKPGAEELEAKFKATLTRATLSGRWCPIQDGQLGADTEDKYTILAVTKLAPDTWLINARIQYGKVDIVAPIPVQVKWAGDTPVIILDNVGIPGGSSYSARVLIFDNTYSGTWSGGNHAGLLHGMITNEKP
jgi:hypothetical protein